MSKNLLIRDLSPEDLEWIKSAKPPGVTQNEFLQSVLADARSTSWQPGLFDHVVQPKVVYANIPFKFIDLFAGIGGFRSAMTSLGGTCVFTNEWDKYACKTYQTWYGDEDVHAGDINEINIADEIPDHDVLCAGFPCQPFSLAGVSKKASLGRAHGFECAAQGNLFFRIMDIVDEKRPPVLFLENVKNLKSHDKGNTWRVIEKNLADRQYTVFSKIIDARSWVPQHRERFFIICFDKHVFGHMEESDFGFPDTPDQPNPLLGEVLHKSAPERKYMLSDKLWAYLQGYAEKHRKKGNGFGYSLFGRGDVARTLSARYHKDGSEVLIKQRGWKNPRRLTPFEARDLMGFDDRYARLFGHSDGFPQVVSDTQAYRQYGNAVVPKVVEAVGKQVVNAMTKTVFRSNHACLLKGDSALFAQHGRP